MDQQQPILQALAAADPEIADRLVTRRDAIARGATLSSVAAAGLRLASVPVALAALSREAFGQQQRLPAVVIGVLNYALVLEELEYEFYQRGTDAAGLIPAQDRAIFETLRAHELDHRNFLRTTLGSSARPKPTFDFTAGNGGAPGPYADVFTNYETFKAVAQAFEDTGVRAYKGQAAALIPYPDVLTAALSIHSVEARHASEVRRLRGMFTDQEPFHQGWITGNRTDVPGAAAVYAGEDNVTQGGVDVTTLPTLSAIRREEVTESFDEPLTQAQVLAIVDPFIV
jgi:rubrerythrin